MVPAPLKRDNTTEPSPAHPVFDWDGWIKIHKAIFWPILVGDLLLVTLICFGCLYRLRALRRKQSAFGTRRTGGSDPKVRPKGTKPELKQASTSGSASPEQALVTVPLLPPPPPPQPPSGVPGVYGPARPLSPLPAIYGAQGAMRSASPSTYVPSSRGPLSSLHPLRIPGPGAGGAGRMGAAMSPRSERTFGPTPDSPTPKNHGLTRMRAEEKAEGQ